ncbi:hypothetical protein N7457_002503 [Penicillium paradoxum]|uniref:uncharacterized protein n=1 Tax=Penicillium paradoxum TaxID=176176 RepID=UPI0025477C21|nr:uncharacterized protein N7457_002503 [Penicillium paradoxum]KAJ5787513.1 hypothetical protein N7457_002503 [Penicillium paradoxum]
MSGPSENGLQPHLHSARSFTRMEDSDVRSPPVEEDSKTTSLSPISGAHGKGPDVFERRGSEDSGTAGDTQPDEGFVLSRSVQDPSEELPIELISLADRFVNSLSAKVHNSPPTIEKISELFQVFYSRAESHIATHISALITRINRDLSPQTPAKAPRGSALSKLSSKRSQDDVRSGAPGRQMLTASEVAEKRKARKALENKRSALEEAAERRVCELVYDKLWRHKSTLDDVRDEKLRSKTAALLLVGINLKDLGIDIDLEAIDQQKQDEANEFLAQAREYLAKMNDYKYPLGKLQQLAAAHKAIVDALTKLLPSSSSADEILPALIYSLVTCPPEGINIISNLVFIQRFRSSSRIDGETAYCLTNLEAAISFLENVDLSTLRADELQDGPVKAPSETTPSSEHIDPFRPTKEKTTTSSVTTVAALPELSLPERKEPASTLPRPQSSVTPQQRRLSNLFQPSSKVLGAANDAVRTTADQSLKNIGATLDSSFNFLFGRLKEMQNIQGPGSEASGPVLPKTLAEARRLVTLPPASATDQTLTQEEIAAINSVSVNESLPPRTSSRLADLSNGGITPRDRSVDSTRTQESGKKTITTSLREDVASNPAISPTPLESMRNFGNTLNPLNHIPGMMKNFGRNAPETPSGRSVSPSGPDKFKPSAASADGNSGAASPVPNSSLKIDPPIQRFLEIQDARDLRIGDIAVLLEDYKRLAAAIHKSTAESR